MQTIRGRLAVWYAVAMVATLVAFAATVYLVERPESRPQIDVNMQARADLIAAILLSRDSVVERDPVSGREELTDSVAALLLGVPDYVLVLGREGTPLFHSGITQTDTTPGGPLVLFGAASPVVQAFVDAVQAQAPQGGVGTVQLAAPFGEVRFYAAPVTTPGRRVTAVVSGVSIRSGALEPQRLLAMMLLVAPLVIAASTGIAYVLAGRTLSPVDRIVDEVEAISDGRSLHRRLASPVSQDELSRLTITVNEMLARLERSFLALRRFTAEASHELKTPLTVLRSGIERAITHPKADPEVLEVLEETLVETNRMTEMVDSLLTLARADEGRAPLHLERVDLRELLAEISETAHILGEQASVSVDVKIPRHPQMLSIDRGRIRQLLMNLLTNAIKYTPAGGRVSIDSVLENGTVVVQVTDTGVGIAPGELPHVFDRFWRADPARSRTGLRAGSGLGLAISKWIAEAHGGSIRAQSRPGRGTTMTVTVPVSEEEN